MENLANNHYPLSNLIRALKPRIEGASLVEVYRQNKQEFVFQLLKQDDHLSLTFFKYGQEAFVFPGNKEKPRHGAPLYFRELYGMNITQAGTFDNDRSFFLTLEDNYRLVFKLYGRHANVISFKAEEPHTFLYYHFRNDREKKFSDYHRRIVQTQDAWQQAVENHETTEQALRSLFPALPRQAITQLEQSGICNYSIHEQWAKIKELLRYMNKPVYFTGTRTPQAKYDPGIMLTVFETEAILHQTTDAEEAFDTFARHFLKQFNLLTLRNPVIDYYNKQIKQLTKKIRNNEQRLDDLQERHNYQELADILMANLHHVKKGNTSQKLYDFYNDRYIDIPLKKDLSPQKNAERYYRKSRNQGLESEKAKEQLEADRDALSKAKEELEAIEHTQDLKLLKKQYSRLFEQPEKVQVNKISNPFREFTYMGYKIYAGKNAKSNDKLTFGFANKNDLWLHARDRQGSHVIIRDPGSGNIPKAVIEYAAALAAKFSGGKGESLCPVVCTRKKYVWKGKGAPPGQARIKNESIIMAEPSE